MSSVCGPDGSELPVYFRLLPGLCELSFLWEHQHMHENMYVLAGREVVLSARLSVLPSCMHRLCVYAKSLHVAICHSLLYSFIHIIHIYECLCAFV